MASIRTLSHSAVTRKGEDHGGAALTSLSTALYAIVLAFDPGYKVQSSKFSLRLCKR